jgi:hypothetical protein
MTGELTLDTNNVNNNNQQTTPNDPDRVKLINSIRQQVRSEIESNPDLYDLDDVQKVLTNDFYIVRFLRWTRGDPKRSLSMILKTFQWRKSSGLIYRTAADFPAEFYAAGALFRYQPDKEGCPTLYMRIKFVRKTAELDQPLKDFIAYQVNQIDTDCGAIMSWTLIFDCNDIGFANVNLDLFRYLITTMANYFPFGIRRIIILDVPWILNKIQKVVFTMLPEEAQKVAIFTSTKHLTDYIDRDNLPDYLGGCCRSPYDSVPDNVKPFDQLTGNFYNLTQKQLNKLRDIYQPFINISASS